MEWGMHHLMLIAALITPTHSVTQIIKKKVTISNPHYYQSHESIPHPPITIWIHGTRFIRRPLYNNFFKGIPSLKLAQDLASDYHLYQIAKTLNKTAPQAFPMETFYLFGWSGKIRIHDRIEAADILYKEIQRIVTEYQNKYHRYPDIRIIGHSHGGNVALYLGKMKQSADESIYIKELILLACPVQESTKKYVADDIFEKTYAFYSTLDVVQVIAPQVVYNVHRTKRGNLRTEMKWNFLSGRCFDHHARLAQVKIKVNGRALFHTEFSRPKFIGLLPHILHVVNSWDVDYTHPPETSKLLCVYTRKEQKINERRSRVRAQ